MSGGAAKTILASVYVDVLVHPKGSWVSQCDLHQIVQQWNERAQNDVVKGPVALICFEQEKGRGCKLEKVLHVVTQPVEKGVIGSIGLQSGQDDISTLGEERILIKRVRAEKNDVNNH